jgi:protein SCO1/2
VSTFLQKNWFKLAISAILVAMIISFAYKLWFTGGDAEHLKSMKPVPELQLEDLQGKPVTNADFDGKVRLVYFYFSSCPDVCPPTTYSLSQVQEALKEKGYFGDKAQIVSITVDPDIDTPPVLQEFGSRYGVDPVGWKFLRGTEAKSRELAEKYGIMVIEDKAGNISHSNAIMIVDPKGNIRSWYDPSDPALTTEFIVKDVIALSKGK